MLPKNEPVFFKKRFFEQIFEPLFDALFQDQGIGRDYTASTLEQKRGAPKKEAREFQKRARGAKARGSKKEPGAPK